MGFSQLLHLEKASAMATLLGPFSFASRSLFVPQNGLGLQQSLIFGLLLFDIVGIQAIKLRLDKGPKSTICGFIK